MAKPEPGSTETANVRRQCVVFVLLLGTNVTLAVLMFAFGFHESITASQPMPPSLEALPTWVLGLANAGMILVLYGLLGFGGLFFTRKLGLPGIFRERAGWLRWAVISAVLGAILGVVLVVSDRLFAAAIDWEGFPHPEFPMSIIASATAGIGEEILFRLFMLGLWAWLLNLVLRRWGAKNVALWAANVIAALAFGAGHLPGAMMLLNVSSPAELDPLLLCEIFLLNGIVGVVAGERFIRDGLVAAVGVHFWTDIVWHVCWPLMSA